MLEDKEPDRVRPFESMSEMSGETIISETVRGLEVVITKSGVRAWSEAPMRKNRFVLSRVPASLDKNDLRRRRERRCFFFGREVAVSAEVDVVTAVASVAVATVGVMVIIAECLAGRRDVRECWVTVEMRSRRAAAQ